MIFSVHYSPYKIEADPKNLIRVGEREPEPVWNEGKGTEGE